MSINLSLKQIQDSDIVADVRDALEESGLAPELLVLEITESVLMDDTDLAVQRLRDSRSSASASRSTTSGRATRRSATSAGSPSTSSRWTARSCRKGSSPEARGLASAVVGLGATLALEVVAEGIEMAEQWDALRDLGCDLGQGFLFARPMAAEASIAFMSAPNAA